MFFTIKWFPWNMNASSDSSIDGIFMTTSGGRKKYFKMLLRRVPMKHLQIGPINECKLAKNAILCHDFEDDVILPTK